MPLARTPPRAHTSHARLARVLSRADGHDQWINLENQIKTPKAKDGEKDDPGRGLMDMMKDLYDNGDDTMKKTLGEAMMKSRQKEMAGLGMDDYSDMEPHQRPGGF